jgi:hypothetical protein
MSKRILLDEKGALRSDASQCSMVQGTAARAYVETANDLAKIISDCSSDRAIALGAPKEELPSPIPITVLKKIKDSPGAITRSREFIDYRLGVPAWCLIDFDAKAIPAPILARIDAEGGLWNCLMTIAPGLSRSARVVRASASAGLFRNDTGESLSGSNGLHIYVLLQDGGDAARFLQYLHDRCWLYDLGWHVIGGAGQLLERSPIDRMVGYGERLCFEGAPLIVPPLKQDPAKRIPRAFDGEAINSRLAAPRLTEYERYRVNQAKVESRDALTKAAQAVRSQHDKMLAEAISAKFGMPSATAQRFVSARHRGVLLPCMELDFDHIGMVPVAAVLSKPDDFVGETLADPLEGASYGRSKAKLMRRGDGTLFIHSFAHGRAFYQLRHDARSAMNAISKAPVEAVVDLAGYRARLREAFGNTMSDEFVDVMLGKVVEALKPTPWDQLEEATLNAALAIIASAHCRSELEALLAVEIVATGFAGLRFLRQSQKHMTEDYINTYGPYASKLLRLQLEMIQTLDRHRRGHKQTVEVRHLHIHSGAQGVVGIVNAGKPDGGDQK